MREREKKKRQSFNKWPSDRTCELWAEQMWTLLHSHSLTHSLSLAVWPLPANSSQYDYADAVAAAAFCLPPPLLFLLMGTTADRLTPSQDYLMTYSRSLTLDLLFFPVLSLILFFLHFLLLLFPYSHLSLSSLCVCCWPFNSVETFSFVSVGPSHHISTWSLITDNTSAECFANVLFTVY